MCRTTTPVPGILHDERAGVATGGRVPYDHAVDPNTARQVLRISPDSPLASASIEAAYANEAWARHPSRYPDAAGRQQAEQWSITLGAAREALLAQAQADATARPDAPAVPAPRRRRLSRGAITGIVAGAVVLVAFVTLVAIGVARVAPDVARGFTDAMEEAAQVDEDAGGEWEPVERYQSGETLYTFPAALEFYYDGRYDDSCPAGFDDGCWQTALFTDADCAAMQVEIGFSNDPDAYEPEYTEVFSRTDVVGNEATPVVYGNDQYDYGWVDDVVCLDAAP